LAAGGAAMIRVAIGVCVVALAIVAAISLQGDPGTASLTWLGWRADSTAAAGVLLIGLLALAAILFWRALVWLLEAPARAARANAEARRRLGGEALTGGFLAAAAGDGPEARRLAQKAAALTQEAPQLVRILTAQAAEAAGDRPAARAAYEAMLGFPEMRLAAHRGLMQIALIDGDAAEAAGQARAAYDLAHTATWAWRALLEAWLEAGDWAGALALVAGAQERKIVSPLIAERARAALQAASAASLGTGARALEFAQGAAKARPDFTPAAAIAAALLTAEGRGPRAAPLVEAAWKARPHPALWLAWRDLRTDETPKARAERLLALAGLHPDVRESRILAVEAALIAGDAPAARAAAEALVAEATTQRLAGLMARVANAAGLRDEARAWIARGAAASREAEWSDIDPTGKAFAYAPADWGRLVAAYAETGALIHPRHERGEATINDLPQIPAAYADSAAFISAAEAGEPFPPIVEDSDFGDALQPAGGEDAPSPPWGFLARKGR
ncbi:MAG: heme biosynthesis HemY N-terminal domain-containing protein, partial [Caulobacteraceae bacterium]